MHQEVPAEEVEDISIRAETLLTDERFSMVVEEFNKLKPGGAVIGEVQNTVLTQGNLLRAELNLPPLEIDQLTCAGFVIDDKNHLDTDGPIVFSYIVDEEGSYIGYAQGTASGKFIPNPEAIRTLMLGMCEL